LKQHWESSKEAADEFRKTKKKIHYRQFNLIQYLIKELEEMRLSELPGTTGSKKQSARIS
jgi:hypothetical protein